MIVLASMEMMEDSSRNIVHNTYHKRRFQVKSSSSKRAKQLDKVASSSNIYSAKNVKRNYFISNPTFSVAS